MKFVWRCLSKTHLWIQLCQIRWQVRELPTSRFLDKRLNHCFVWEQGISAFCCFLGVSDWHQVWVGFACWEEIVTKPTVYDPNLWYIHGNSYDLQLGRNLTPMPPCLYRDASVTNRHVHCWYDANLFSSLAHIPGMSLLTNTLADAWQSWQATGIEGLVPDLLVVLSKPCWICGIWIANIARFCGLLVPTNSIGRHCWGRGRDCTALFESWEPMIVEQPHWRIDR